MPTEVEAPALVIDVAGLIRRAAVDPEMRAKAGFVAGQLIASAFQPQDHGGIRPSSYGSCRLALWATIHGREDIARDAVDDYLAKMDLGTMTGAWNAALLYVAASREGWDVLLEFVPEGGGHIDGLCRKAHSDGLDHETHGVSHVVEFKSQWSSGAIPDPASDSPQHLLQAADYALRTSSPRFTLVYLRPGAKKGERLKQWEYEAAPYRLLIEAERERLSAALLDDPPMPDPQNRWSCYTCRVSTCRKNKNGAAESADALFA
jgi:hypothetical protein